MKKSAVRSCLLILVFVMILIGSGCQQDNATTTTTQTTSATVGPSTIETIYELDAKFSVVEQVWDASNEPVELGGYSYFLDTEKLLTNGKESGFMLCRRANTEESIVPLNILSYSIEIYGEHLFLLQFDGQDLSSPYDAVNKLVRLEADGSVTTICRGLDYYGFGTALTQINDQLYFTRYNESAIFKSDLNGENIERIAVVLPVDVDPFEYIKVTARGELFNVLNIYSIENGLISFTFEIQNESHQAHFFGSYKMSVSDYKLDEVVSVFQDERQTIDSYLYYLDLEHPFYASEYDEPIYNLHRMKPNGSDDENLGVHCFRYERIGDFIYADTDLSFGDFGHWNTVRCNMDGKNQISLPYGDMNRYTEGDRLYFTEGWDDTIYIADTACAELETITIIIPDESAIQTAIVDIERVGFISVYDRDGEWLYFFYSVTDLQPATLYEGKYRVNLNTKVVEKVNAGEFFSP